MAKPMKKRGAFLKLAGTGVLLVSFVTQNFLFEKWNSRSAELTAAMHDRQLIDKGALLNEVLYFVSRISPQVEPGPAPSAIAEFKVSQAASKTAMSEAIAVWALDSIPEEKKRVLVDRLMTNAQAVRDYAGLVSLFAVINDEYGPYSDQLNVEYHAIQSKRSGARVIYLNLYISGAIILLLGLFFEWRGAEE